MPSIDFVILDRERNVQVRFQRTVLETKCDPSASYSVIDGILQRTDGELAASAIESVEAADAPLLVKWTLPVPKVEHIPRADIQKLDYLANFLEGSSSGLHQGVKLLVPNNKGYIMSSQIFEERLRGAPYIRKVEENVYPRQLVGPPDLSDPSLAALIQSVVCCITVDGVNPESVAQSLDAVQSQLSNRLSLRWLSPTRIPRRRLAVIGELRPYSMSWRFFQAARALGVSVVAYGPPGHWLEAESQGSQFREAFIPLDLTGDAGLPSRIAAEQLNLSTSPSQAYSKSVNKYQCRLKDGSNSCLLVRSTAELHDLVATNEETVPVPGPPWIVKPCNGWHSLNVVKASNYEALLEAVQKVSSHAAYTRAAPAKGDPRWQTDALVEEYCDGPEVDCNFVLWTGQVLFFEEMQLLFPSALPRAEQNALRDSLLQSILRLGFNSGVSHVEARVRHSNHEYRETDGQTMDLHPRPNPPASDPGIFLIEINARPPGYVDTCSSAFANGVDLFALQILIARGDEERVHALSQPFQVPPHVAIAAIQAERSGTVVSDDPWGDLRNRDPALMDHVVQHVMNFEKGEHVEDPSLDTTPWLSAFMAYSTASRADLLKLCADVKARFVCRIE
ncbi:hypothetical protein IFM61392_07919 [Aspergillus lentulus]|uniref:ATP-grasp domain-containing protein n=2 Tax=Aspergillus lentulus TaxID=293939 RepID=A0ABQ1AIS4_ASPLE|nr:hypothetical protein IFM62136_07412 [Aspergillus lentulus]GFF82692.1 hypothetical protein IFM60648_06439 [Aspergillus lentulus]GFF91582.1 hypothetical protein IFM47457_08891 [Aspergillus lentulus]GFG13415.1 hypothetical protein IFM61392_07919 [Aspergillus lentulus]